MPLKSSRDSKSEFCLPKAVWYIPKLPSQQCSPTGPSPPCDSIPRNLTLDSLPHATSLITITDHVLVLRIYEPVFRK